MDPYIECKHSAEYNQEKDEEAHTPIAAGSMNTVNSTTRTGDYEKTGHDDPRRRLRDHGAQIQ